MKRLLCALLLCLCGTQLWAAGFSATVDRARLNEGETFDLILESEDVTQFGSKFAVADLTQDGYASGDLTSINISNNGMVMASYSNGVTRSEAQVALANFRNPQGLLAVAHRIVHGGPHHHTACLLDDAVLAKLGATVGDTLDDRRDGDPRLCDPGFAQAAIGQFEFGQNALDGQRRLHRITQQLAQQAHVGALQHGVRGLDCSR